MKNIKFLFLAIMASLLFSNAVSAQKTNKDAVSDFDNFGLHYTANFEYPGEGAIMLLSQVFFPIDLVWNLVPGVPLVHLIFQM